MNLNPSLIIVLFLILPFLTWLFNRPRKLRKLQLVKLISEFIKKDVESIPIPPTRPKLYSSRENRTPPMLNIRPTIFEVNTVYCPKDHLHCQNCEFCSKTAVIHSNQWIFCTNKDRITLDGLVRHHWHKPATALPCHTRN